MNRRLLNLMCLALPAAVLAPKTAQAGRNPPSKPQPNSEPVPGDTPSTPTPAASHAKPTLKPSNVHKKSQPKCKAKPGQQADCVDSMKTK
jgi:hypothetical protein